MPFPIKKKKKLLHFSFNLVLLDRDHNIPHLVRIIFDLESLTIIKFLLGFTEKEKEKKKNLFCFHNSWILLNRTARTRLKSHVRVEWCWVHDIHTSSLSLSLYKKSSSVFGANKILSQLLAANTIIKESSLPTLLFWFFCQPSWLERLTYSEDI